MIVSEHADQMRTNLSSIWWYTRVTFYVQYNTIAYIVLNQNKCSNMSEKKVLELSPSRSKTADTQCEREKLNTSFTGETQKKTQNWKKQIFKYYIKNDKKYRLQQIIYKWRGKRKKISKLCHEIWKINTFEWNRSPNCHRFSLFIEPRQLLHSTRISPIKMEINNMMLNSVRSGVIFSVFFFN